MFKTYFLTTLTLIFVFLFGALQMSMYLPESAEPVAAVVPAGTTATATVATDDMTFLEKAHVQTIAAISPVWAFMRAEDNQWVYDAVYIMFLVLPFLIFIIYLLEKRAGKKDFTTDTVNGKITITIVAMKKFIRCICNTVPGISSCYVTLRKRRRKMDARVVVKVASPDSWLSVKQELLDRIPQAVSQVMGADVINSLEVVCQDLTSVKLVEEPESRTDLEGPITTARQDVDRHVVVAEVDKTTPTSY